MEEEEEEEEGGGGGGGRRGRRREGSINVRDHLLLSTVRVEERV